MTTDGDYVNLERSTETFWASSRPTSSGSLTLEMLQRAADDLAQREPQPPVLVCSEATLEGAGRGIGWPDLEEHFETLARGAAHTIFGNIALDIRAAVTPRAAGVYILAGKWPFTVAEWSEPRSWWGE